MKETEPTHPEAHSFEVVKNIFENHFDGSFEGVKREDIPEKALTHFEGHSSLYISPNDYKEGNFTEYYFVRRKDGLVTYIASQIKVYKGTAMGKNVREINVYFYDM